MQLTITLKIKKKNMNADKIILKQRTSTSYEVSEANMYKLIDNVYNLFINQKI